MTKREYAIQLKKQKNNCAQAVLCAFAEETGLSQECLRKIGAGLGLGMGCMEGTCGALSAAEIILGLVKFEGKPVLKDASTLLERFRKMCGSAICKEIKGRDTGQILCSCEDCVGNAAELLEEMIG